MHKPIVGHCILYNGCVPCISVADYSWFVRSMKGCRCYMLIYIYQIFLVLLCFGVKCIVLVVFVGLNAICKFVCLNSFVIFLTSGLK